MLADYLGLGEQLPAEIRSYWTNLQARDGYRRAMAAQETAALEQNVSTMPAPQFAR